VHKKAEQQKVFSIALLRVIFIDDINWDEEINTPDNNEETSQ